MTPTGKFLRRVSAAGAQRLLWEGQSPRWHSRPQYAMLWHAAHLQVATAPHAAQILVTGSGSMWCYRDCADELLTRL